MKPWTSRKFWSAMFWQVVFTWLLILKVLPADVYFSLSLITLGGYFAANVLDKKYGSAG